MNATKPFWNTTNLGKYQTESFFTVIYYPSLRKTKTPTEYSLLSMKRAFEQHWSHNLNIYSEKWCSSYDTDSDKYTYPYACTSLYLSHSSPVLSISITGQRRYTTKNTVHLSLDVAPLQNLMQNTTLHTVQVGIKPGTSFIPSLPAPGEVFFDIWLMVELSRNLLIEV